MSYYIVVKISTRSTEYKHTVKIRKLFLQDVDSPNSFAATFLKQDGKKYINRKQAEEDFLLLLSIIQRNYYNYNNDIEHKIKSKSNVCGIEIVKEGKKKCMK